MNPGVLYRKTLFSAGRGPNQNDHKSKESLVPGSKQSAKRAKQSEIFCL